MEDDLDDSINDSFVIQQYTPPEKVPRRINGYKPSNCGEPKDLISNINDRRDAYRYSTAHINNDPCSNCCTIEADNQVKLWTATELR